jgi:DNA (cytosine-5)-methyltransferase 1
MLTVGSLFSGIGGIEKGLEATHGFRTIWNCEIEAYPSAVLKKHWADVPNLGDITKVDWATVERPDLICGGFPCQDISIAGKRKGIKEGTRSGLWFEYAKAIRILRPRYVLVENVAEILNGGGLAIVLADFASIGYDAEWQLISASAVGAPHTRKRMFLIAYPNGIGCDTRQHNWEGNGILQDRKRNMEDAEKDRNGQPPNLAGSSTPFTSNSDSIRLQRFKQKEVSWEFREFDCWKNIKRIEDLQGRPDIPKPLIRRGDDGFSNRMERTKCLGNAVVPQVAEVVGRQILEMEEGLCTPK